jgi:hypothetical protein
VNIDNLNLAELLFVNREYDRALESARRFLAADAHPQILLKGVAEFYVAASQRGRGDMSREKFERELDALISLQARKDLWAWDVLSEFTRNLMPDHFEEHRSSLKRLVEMKGG